MRRILKRARGILIILFFTMIAGALAVLIDGIELKPDQNIARFERLIRAVENIE